MDRFEFDRYREKEANAILDYFKLLYIEKLTYNTSTDTFKMLDGDKLYKKILRYSEEDIINLEASNFILLNTLKSDLRAIFSGVLSPSGMYEEKFTQLDWLPEIISVVEPDKTAKESIINFSSFCTYNDVLNKNDRLGFKNIDDSDMLSQMLYINEMVKKRKNS